MSSTRLILTKRHTKYQEPGRLSDVTKKVVTDVFKRVQSALSGVKDMAENCELPGNYITRMYPREEFKKACDDIQKCEYLKNNKCFVSLKQNTTVLCLLPTTYTDKNGLIKYATGHDEIQISTKVYSVGLDEIKKIILNIHSNTLLWSIEIGTCFYNPTTKFIKAPKGISELEECKYSPSDMFSAIHHSLRLITKYREEYTQKVINEELPPPEYDTKWIITNEKNIRTESVRTKHRRTQRGDRWCKEVIVT